MSDDMGRVFSFDGVDGGLSAGLEIAGFLDLRLNHVAGIEELRRIGPHRLFFVRKVRQRLVLDPDETRRVDGLLLGGRRDRSHFVPLIHHPLANLDVNEPSFDTRSFQGGRQVDREHARVCVGRAKDFSVQHPGARHVERVLRPTLDFVGTIEPLDARANQPRLIGPRILRVRRRHRRRWWRRSLLGLIIRARFVSHVPPLSLKGLLQPRAHGYRSGRCSRREPDGLVRAWDWDFSRAARRSP